MGRNYWLTVVSSRSWVKAEDQGGRCILRLWAINRVDVELVGTTRTGGGLLEDASGT
jgi:hypothetical protein